MEQPTAGDGGRQIAGIMIPLLVHIPCDECLVQGTPHKENCFFQIVWLGNKDAGDFRF